MKIHEIQHGIVSTIELMTANGEDFGGQVSSRAEAQLVLSELTGDHFLRVGPLVNAVKGTDARNCTRLSQLLDRNLHR